MKEADYDSPTATSMRCQRVGSLLALLVLAGLEWNGVLAGGIRMISAQVVATGVIWWADGEFFEPVLQRHVTYRTVAWLVLIASPLAFTLLLLATKPDPS